MTTTSERRKKKLLREANAINTKLFGREWKAKIPRNTSIKTLRAGIKRGKSALKRMNGR